MRTLPVRGSIVLAACMVAISGDGRNAFSSELSDQVILYNATAAAADARAVAVQADVRDFYAAREGDPAWVDDRASSARAASALRVLRSAIEHGLNPADYGDADIAARLNALASSDPAAPDRMRQVADLDARITTALLTLGRDVAIGRTSPMLIRRTWRARRPAPDLAGTLIAAADEDLDTWLAQIAPHHQQYGALMGALAALRRTAAGPLADRQAQQVALNLERWRWMPDDLGPRYLLVNIPAFEVYVRENGLTVRTIRVIVGKRTRETPIFSGTMTTVVFSPYWNIPDSIAIGETVPAIARNPEYLAKNHIQILRRTASGNVVVPPSQVNWDDPAQLRSLAFRQLPGADNALGHVKFLFPNPFNVYLHDTPADALFARPGRAFSHGCIRLEEPEALAQYVLRDDPAWTTEAIEAAMHLGVENSVMLKQPIPVHVAYFTAWVTDQGALQLPPDVYGYDAKQLAGMRR